MMNSKIFKFCIILPIKQHPTKPSTKISQWEIKIEESAHDLRNNKCRFLESELKVGPLQFSFPQEGFAEVKQQKKTCQAENKGQEIVRTADKKQLVDSVWSTGDINHVIKNLCIKNIREK